MLMCQLLLWWNVINDSHRKLCYYLQQDIITASD